MDKSNYPNITCTEGILSGAPRIDGRRLAVGDVIAFASFDGITATETAHELTLESIQEAIHYCARQQCLKDQPSEFCHNCTLRTQQEPSLDLSLYQKKHLME